MDTLNEEMREVSISFDLLTNTENSCLIKFGNTVVICKATIEETVPPFLRKSGLGWVTAEYGMLPGSTNERMRREAKQIAQSGRTQEIQRLIGRSLRVAVDRVALGERQIIVDCDVIQADGGTRTASICGAFIALKFAIKKLLENGSIKENPIKDDIAAISAGICKGVVILDLCYLEDSVAEVDANFVMTSSGKIIEIQSTAEAEPFSEKHLDEMLSISKKGINEIMQMQKNLFD